MSLNSFPTTACPSLCAIPAFPVRLSSCTYLSHVTGKFEDPLHRLCTHRNQLSHTMDGNAGPSCTHANSRLMMRRALMLNRRRVPLPRHSSCCLCVHLILPLFVACKEHQFSISMLHFFLHDARARFGMSAHTRRGPATFGCILRIDHAEMLPGIVLIMALLMRYRIGWNVGLLLLF